MYYTIIEKHVLFYNNEAGCPLEVPASLYKVSPHYYITALTLLTAFKVRAVEGLPGEYPGQMIPEQLLPMPC